MIPNKKHIIAKQIADRISNRSEQQCTSTEQKDQWLAKYAQAINTLSVMEDLKKEGKINLDYTPNAQPTPADHGRS